MIGTNRCRVPANSGEANQIKSNQIKVAQKKYFFPAKPMSQPMRWLDRNNVKFMGFYYTYNLNRLEILAAGVLFTEPNHKFVKI